MDNEKKATTAEAEDTEKAMQSFLSGSNDYEIEKDTEEKSSAPVKLNKHEVLICALAVFSLALWLLSNHIAAILCGLAIALTVIVKPGKDTVHCVAANGIAFGTMTVVRIVVNVVGELISHYYSYIAEANSYSEAQDLQESYALFNETMSVISAIIGITVFVLFIINACCFASKKRTFVFGSLAAKLSDRDDENTDSEEGKE